MTSSSAPVIYGVRKNTLSYIRNWNDLDTINSFVCYYQLNIVSLTKTSNKFFKPAQKEEISHSKFKQRFWKFQIQIFEKAVVGLYVNNNCLGEQLPLLTRKKLG